MGKIFRAKDKKQRQKAKNYTQGLAPLRVM
jgi:hypothetical protein